MDFFKLCKQYCDVYILPGDPNLDLLKLTIDGDVTWTDITPQTQRASDGASREQSQLNDVPTLNDSELPSNVEAMTESLYKIRVSLLQGIAPGLDKPLRIPTSGLPPSLGQYVEIQLDKAIHEKEDKMTVKVDSAHKMDSSNLALATVSRKENYFVGQFSCNVKMRGNVLFPLEDGTLQEYGIADVVNDVKVWPRRNKQTVEEDLKAIQVVRDDFGAPEKVTWAVTGVCEFQ